MHRYLNPSRALPAYGGTGQGAAGGKSLHLLFRLPLKAYNAVFTPMGRKSVYYFFKRSQAKMNPEFRKEGALVYQLNNGHPFVLHQGNNLSELVFLEGAYEPLETLIVSKVVQQGDVVLDLGANVGYFTALLDRLVQAGGQVHAFEPGEKTFAKLNQTKKLIHLDRSALHQKAIGDSVGQVDFWSSTSGSDAQQHTSKTAVFTQHMRRDTVASTTLDAFVASLPAQDANRIAFVKCDIEGAEPGMLKGANALLNSKNPPVWLIEHNREALLEQGVASHDLLAPFAGSEIYFTPLCWPPSIMAASRPSPWDGHPESLPEECNLLIFPKRGVHAGRAGLLREAGLLP